MAFCMARTFGACAPWCRPREETSRRPPPHRHSNSCAIGRSSAQESISVMMAFIRRGSRMARRQAMGFHCQELNSSVGKLRNSGWPASISWPMQPDCVGKVQTDQKSGLNWACTERGSASAVLSGAR